ncbi:MAG: hypothetical protein U5K29_11560 [Acidimicrobiales bacterium]|nr:hypothetical protein [Acidimicrobiales bacterium]
MTETSGAQPPEGHDDLTSELAQLVGDADLARRALEGLRSDLIAPLDPALTEQHLAAMSAAAPQADEPAAEVVDLRSRRVRRATVGTVVGLIAIGSTGGLAAAGHLPPVIQDPLSRVAGVVSIDLPRSTPDATIVVPRTPGTTGDTPGATVDAPGTSNGSPSDTAPGQTGNTPSDTAPGQSSDTPGDTAPGQGGSPVQAPGVTPPGQGGDTPSDTAPGQTGNTPSDTAPGQTGDTPGDTPGDTAPGQGGSPVQAPGVTPPGQGGQGQGGSPG